MATLGSQVRQGQRGPSQEYLLLDYLQRLGRGSLEDRTAVHLHLSRLRPHNRRAHHIRIAAATFEGIVQNYEGQSFILSNSDIFFICKGASLQDIDTAVMKVRFLFSEDPLAQGDEDEDLGQFVTWYNLENQFDEVLDLSKSLHRERERQARMQASGQTPQNRNRGRKAILTGAACETRRIPRTGGSLEPDAPTVDLRRHPRKPGPACVPRTLCFDPGSTADCPAGV